MSVALVHDGDETQDVSAVSVRVRLRQVQDAPDLVGCTDQQGKWAREGRGSHNRNSMDKWDGLSSLIMSSTSI